MKAFARVSVALNLRITASQKMCRTLRLALLEIAILLHQPPGHRECSADHQESRPVALRLL